MKRALVAAVLLSISSTALVAQALWSGRFQTNFGPMTFTSRGGEVFGEYPQYSGRTRQAPDDAGTLNGYWMQPRSDVRCNRLIEGTFHWGYAEFRFNRNGTFTGLWGYCDEAPTRPWTGQRG